VAALCLIVDIFTGFIRSSLIHTYIEFITRSMVKHVARIGGAGGC